MTAIDEPPPPALTIIASQTKAATHSVCRLNPLKRGAAKWEPMFFVADAGKMSAEEVTAELVHRQRLSQRDVTRAKVKVIKLGL